MTGERLSMKLLRALVVASSILIVTSLAGCDDTPPTERERSVEYRPLRGDDWVVSTPEEQDLGAALIDDLYENAAKLETLYRLLVVKDGFLIAEQYFNGGSVDEKTLSQSASNTIVAQRASLHDTLLYRAKSDRTHASCDGCV